MKQQIQEVLPAHSRHKASALPSALKLSPAVHEQIRETIGCQNADRGGILGVNSGSSIVEHFYFDESGGTTNITYTPDHAALNDLLRNKWAPLQIAFAGFVHSHPKHIKQPTAGDIVYAHAILDKMPSLSYLYLPIVLTIPDSGSFRLISYAALRQKHGVRIKHLGLLIEDSADEGWEEDGMTAKQDRIDQPAAALTKTEFVTVDVCMQFTFGSAQFRLNRTRYRQE